MSLKDELYTYLSSVIGHDRIYPDVAPEGAATPYITYQYVSLDRRHSFAGPVGFQTRRVQFDIYADTADEVDEQAYELSDQLDGYNQQAMGNVFIQEVRLEDERDGFINPIAGTQVPKHRRIIDYFITYNHAIPGESA